MASNGAAANGHDPEPFDSSRAPVHSFDPEASPAEKGAQAGQAADKLSSVVLQSPPKAEQEVKVQAPSPPAVPTITINGAQKHAPEQDQDEDEEDDEVQGSMPGDIPSGQAPPIPDWYTVGWRQASGIDDAPLTGEAADAKSVLDQFITDQYYGEWYHNAAVIVFAVVTTHFLTRFGFGWGWIFILLASCSTYYSTSMRRTRRHARDDIQRELVKTRLGNDHESADWINNFLDRFWLIYEPVLSNTIISSVDQVLSASTPAFLDSLRLTTFTLGTKAPRIDRVHTFPRTEDDIVMMDWGISFTPTDVSDMTPKQAAGKVNPKIVLSVRVGKGIATAAMPILVEDITFSGLMRIRMKLMTNFPHVQLVDICFLEKPVIDYVLKPIGGETFGFDIANIPGLSSFIRDMTHATMGPMMYAPNVFTLNLEQLLSGTPLDTSIGVLQVTIHSARGIKGTKIGGGTPDPYVALSINNRAELAKTKYKNDTYNPTWMETKFILITSLTESLYLNVYDYNDHRKDSLMGTAMFELSRLQDDATQEGITSNLLVEGKERGELRYDISFFPVLKPQDGEDIVETTAGIVRVTIHQAKELDATKSMSGDLNPLAKLFLGDTKAPIHTTKSFKHTRNPVWESSHEFICTNKGTAVLTFKVIDDRDFFKDPVIGYMSIKLEDLLAFKQENLDWFKLSNCQSGKLRVSAEWKPLSLAGSLHGADQYKPPIGVIRLFLEKATDVKNVEAALGGKSDPYTRVLVNNVTLGRTEVVNNNLNPVWNQYVYIPVHSLKETVLLEVVDYQHLTRDRGLGTTELHTHELAEESDDPTAPFKSKGVKTAVEGLRQDKSGNMKGDLHYRAEFIPAMKIKGAKFAHHGNELEQAVDGDSDGGHVTDTSSMSSSDVEAQEVPIGVTIRGPHKHHKKNVKSTDTTATAVSNADNDTSPRTPTTPLTPYTAGGTREEEEGVELSHEELLTHQSGVIIFNIVFAQLSKKGRIEVLLDDAYWPAFSTSRARSTKMQWDYVGEGFLKELDFGKVWLRLNEADEGDKDDIHAEWQGEAKDFLKNTLAGPQTFTLLGDDDRPTTVTVESRYVPVPVQLEPRESINNQGLLRVDLINARDVHAADRSGKSDPFATFVLNDQKVFKSQTKKKTLNPDWNEEFTVSVPSRVDADFSVEIFDWNQVEQAKSLGVATIKLDTLEAFEAAELELPLVSPKLGQKGHIRLRLLFQPGIIAKSRKNTSTFSSAGRALTQVGGLPVNAGKGVFHGVTGLFKNKNNSEDSIPPVPSVPAGQASHPIGKDFDNVKAFPSTPSNGSLDGGAELGTLKVTAQGAKDLSASDAKAYLTIRVGDREVKTKHAAKGSEPEWNESFTVAAGAATKKLYVWVHDHRTLGKDKLLGDGEIDIWRHIQHTTVSGADVLCELRDGQGLVKVRLEFDPTANPNPGRTSMSSPSRTESIKGSQRRTSFASPSRFSIRSKRPGTEDEEA